MPPRWRESRGALAPAPGGEGALAPPRSGQHRDRHLHPRRRRHGRPGANARERAPGAARRGARTLPGWPGAQRVQVEPARPLGRLRATGRRVHALLLHRHVLQPVRAEHDRRRRRARPLPRGGTSARHRDQLRALRPGEGSRAPDGARGGGLDRLSAVRAPVAARGLAGGRGSRCRARLVDVPSSGTPAPRRQPVPAPGGDGARALLARPRAPRPRGGRVARLPPDPGRRAVRPRARGGRRAAVLLLSRPSPRDQRDDRAPPERGGHRRARGRLSLLPRAYQRGRLDRRDARAPLVRGDGDGRAGRRGALPRLGRRAAARVPEAGGAGGRVGGVTGGYARSAASCITARVISAAATMSLTFSHSPVVWISRMPVPRFTTSRPRPLRTLASQPPPKPAAVTVRPVRAAAATTSRMMAESSATAIGW